eukprot:SAG31_NODE_836_length_11643_cov_3.389813_6_plen_226_part_00
MAPPIASPAGKNDTYSSAAGTIITRPIDSRLLMRTMNATAALLFLPLVTAVDHAEQTTAHCPTSAAIVRRQVEQLCGGLSVADALRVVEAVEIDAARLLLDEHGLQRVMDLRLLAAVSDEGIELMEQLRIGGISIGDRSKVRLLLDGGATESAAAQIVRKAEVPSVSRTKTAPDGKAGRVESEDEPFVHRRPRQLQGASESGGLSTDTLAIVLSVLLGAVGYVVQ